MTYLAKFTTQTDEPPPWIDCGWATASMWIDKGTAGQVPKVDKDTLRAASGDKVGGSSIFDLTRGVNRLFPSVAMPYNTVRSWPEVEDLGSKGYGFAVLIDHGKWPASLRRFSPGFKGGHWVYIEDFQTTPSMGRTFRLLNPLGRAGYNGERANTNDMRTAAAPFLDSVSPVLEGSLMSTVTDRETFAQRKFTIAKGIVTGYAMNSTTGRYELGKTIDIKAPTTLIVADAKGTIEQYPVKGRNPSGAHVRIVNGAFSGQWIPEASGVLDPAPTPEPIDCGALVTAAVTPLKEAIAAANAALDAVAL